MEHWERYRKCVCFSINASLPSTQTLQRWCRAAESPPSHRPDALSEGLRDPLAVPFVQTLQSAGVQNPCAARIHPNNTAQLKGSSEEVCLFLSPWTWTVFWGWVWDLSCCKWTISAPCCSVYSSGSGRCRGLGLKHSGSLTSSFWSR